ncbi:MAG: PAS domain-containing sensor histidine kinase [Clostridiales bacterium]|nr:PAS domain-containing sensor histidine kinase [Clostridiales bacterium]
MKKRIFINIAALILVCVILLALSFVFLSKLILPAVIVITLAALIFAYFFAHRTADKYKDELYPFIRKIERQKIKISRQMKKIEKRTETVEAIIENMREGLVLLNRKGLVVSANKAVSEIFEITDDITKKNIREIYRDPDFIKAVRKCLRGWHMEFSFSKNNRNYNVFLNPVNSGNNKRGAIIFFLDTTEQSKAEKQRKEFTANVSHELRTPLTTISALSEMMATGMVKPDDIADFSEKISAHTERLINIINDIIQLSEFDENKVAKKFELFDVFESAKSVIASLNEKAEKKSVTLELTGQPLTINANPRLLDELMYNLLDNGIKYNNEGGSVTLDISEEDCFCKISVTDTGIGIPPELSERVFERFFRADPSRATGGTGLGLSIVKHITEHHGGKIALKSTDGKGTMIVCYIPLEIQSGNFINGEDKCQENSGFCPKN